MTHPISLAARLAIRLNSNNTVDRNSAAVKNNYLKVTSLGDPDPDSVMFRREWARLKCDGSFDRRFSICRSIQYAIDPNALKTSDIRDQYKQKLFRDSDPSNSVSSDEVAHGVSLSVGLELIKHRHGRHLTIDQYVAVLHEVLNNNLNLSMEDRDTNRIEHCRLDNEIIKALKQEIKNLSSPAKKRALSGAKIMRDIATANIDISKTGRSVAFNFTIQLENVANK
ncbi:hypothetical protein P9112_000419 [Eukaryota sp. TZLM1-RC]